MEFAAFVKASKNTILFWQCTGIVSEHFAEVTWRSLSWHVILVSGKTNSWSPHLVESTNQLSQRSTAYVEENVNFCLCLAMKILSSKSNTTNLVGKLPLGKNSRKNACPTCSPCTSRLPHKEDITSSCPHLTSQYGQRFCSSLKNSIVLPY